MLKNLFYLFLLTLFFSCKNDNYFTKLNAESTKTSTLSASPDGADPSSDPSNPGKPSDPKDPKNPKDPKSGGGCDGERDDDDDEDDHHGHKHHKVDHAKKEYCPKNTDKFDETALRNIGELKQYSCDQKNTKFAICHETGRVSATGNYIKEYLEVDLNTLTSHFEAHRSDFGLKNCLSPKELANKEIRVKICNCSE